MTQYYVQEYGFDLKRAALLAACFALPAGTLRAVGGWLSDHIGRRYLMLLLTVVTMALIHPMLRVMMRAPVEHFAWSQALLAIPIGMALGLQGSMVVELFPLRTRVTSVSFGYSVTLAVAGTQYASPADLLPPRVKHRSRLFWHIADRTTHDPASPFYRPGAVPVVLTQDGVADTAIGRIVSVVDGTVIRPLPETVQDSISLKVLAELCHGLSLPVANGRLDFRRICQPVEGHRRRSGAYHRDDDPNKGVSAGEAVCREHGSAQSEWQHEDGVLPLDHF